jgi:hypothetical protein
MGTGMLVAWHQDTLQLLHLQEADTMRTRKVLREMRCCLAVVTAWSTAWNTASMTLKASLGLHPSSCSKFRRESLVYLGPVGFGSSRQSRSAPLTTTRNNIRLADVAAACCACSCSCCCCCGTGGCTAGTVSDGGSSAAMAWCACCLLPVLCAAVLLFAIVNTTKQLLVPLFFLLATHALQGYVSRLWVHSCMLHDQAYRDHACFLD